MDTSLLVVSIIEVALEVTYVVTALMAARFAWLIYKNTRHIKNIDE